MQNQRIRIHLKITLLYTVLTVSTVLLFSFLLYFFSERLSSRDFYKRLQTRANIVANSHFTTDTSGKELILDFRNQYLEKLPHEREYIIKLKAGVNENVRLRNLYLPENFYRELYQLGAANYRKGRVYYTGIVYFHDAERYLILVSAENDYVRTQLKNLRTILFSGFVLSALFIFGIGWLFSKRIFLPIRRITQKVQNINTENLHLRLNVSKKGDKISELARTFNNMLDRLETSFDSQNNFVSNASHELSTPLTSIIGEAELALQKERSAERYQEAMTIILKEAERLKAIIQSLLNLAQTGFNGIKQSWTNLRADELIMTARDVVKKIYPENKIRVDYALLPEDETKLNIQGNEKLLVLALTNIMLNACKYSQNDEVIVALAASNTKLFIVIKDKGIGIPSHELPYIYDPFFRASNTGEIKGYGIGLPLARNIIRMHHADLQVHSAEGKGTEVQITFPLS